MITKVIKLRKLKMILKRFNKQKEIKLILKNKKFNNFHYI